MDLYTYLPVCTPQKGNTDQHSLPRPSPLLPCKGLTKSDVLLPEATQINPFQMFQFTEQSGLHNVLCCDPPPRSSLFFLWDPPSRLSKYEQKSLLGSPQCSCGCCSCGPYEAGKGASRTANRINPVERRRDKRKESPLRLPYGSVGITGRLLLL